MKLVNLICLVIILLGSGAKAENMPSIDAEQYYEREMSLDLCRSLEHRFETTSHACVYCAHGLHYEGMPPQCIGTPDVIGKCYGDDHYHAQTQECMYCGKGYAFNEDIRECMVVPDAQEDAEKKGE